MPTIVTAEIHGGDWHATDRAFGGSKHDAAITVMSKDGIVATISTTHCGLMNAEDLTRRIAHEHNCHTSLLYALEIVVAQNGVPSEGDWKVIRSALAAAKKIR